MKRNNQRPPLPFFGNKIRWWRELERLALSLPMGGCVFDAFGGSFSAARVIKDTRPDLTVITNDYGHAYRQRLNAAPQTAEVLKQLQAIAPKRPYAEYTGFDDETREKCMAIVGKATDSQTAWSWLYSKSTIRNKVPTTASVDVERCLAWTDGLVVISEYLDAIEARYVVNSGAFVILDPPYHGKNQKSYADGHRDAQAFSRAIIETGNAWCLFEQPGSPLVNLAMPLATEIIPYAGKRNNRWAREIMLIRQPQRS